MFPVYITMPRPKSRSELRQDIETLAQYVKTQQNFEKKAALATPEPVKNSAGDVIKDYRRLLNKHFKDALDPPPTVETVLADHDKGKLAEKINSPIIEAIKSLKTVQSTQRQPQETPADTEEEEFQDIPAKSQAEYEDLFDEINRQGTKRKSYLRTEGSLIKYGNLNVLPATDPNYIMVGDYPIPLTDGIKAVLMGKDSGYTDEDLQNIYPLAVLSGAIFKDYNQSSGLMGGKSDRILSKFKAMYKASSGTRPSSIESPKVEKRAKRDPFATDPGPSTSLTGSSGKTKTGGGISSGGARYYYTDASHAMQQLNLLIGARMAGNTSPEVQREATMILDYLKKTGSITKSDYRRLVKMLM